MIADLLAYLRDGWQIWTVDAHEGRDGWFVCRRRNQGDEFLFVPLPDGWVKPQ